MDKRLKHYPEAAKMYLAGLSVQDVAAFHGITRQAMWAWLKKRRVPMRSNLRFGRKIPFFRNGRRADKAAIHLVEKAIIKGVLVRPPVCENCGKPYVYANGKSGIEAHHDDYNKPLEVRWLCQGCHHEWHKHHRAKSRTRPMSATST